MLPMDAPPIPPALTTQACVDLANAREAFGFEVGRTYAPGRLVALTCSRERPAGVFVTFPRYQWTEVIPLHWLRAGLEGEGTR